MYMYIYIYVYICELSRVRARSAREAGRELAKRAARATF